MDNPICKSLLPEKGLIRLIGHNVSGTGILVVVDRPDTGCNVLALTNEAYAKATAGLTCLPEAGDPVAYDPDCQAVEFPVED